jgi:hypothetical protein
LSVCIVSISTGVPAILKIVTGYDAYYPGGSKRIHLVNCPKAFESLYRLMLPLMGDQLRGIFKIYDYNKNEWMEHVLKDVAPEQMIPAFGGSKNGTFHEH